jgi:hypothetical protein
MHQDKITITIVYLPNAYAHNINEHTVMELKSQTDSNTEVVVILTLFHQQHPDKKTTKKFYN